MAHVGAIGRSLVCKRSFAARANHVTVKLVATQISRAVSGQNFLAQTSFQHVLNTEPRGQLDGIKQRKRGGRGKPVVPLLERCGNYAIGLVLDDCLEDKEMGELVVSCHFALDVLSK